MGNANDNNAQEWTDSVTFGGKRRQASFFSDKFGIGGTIVEVRSINENKVVIVVNKRINYGIRLIIYDDRYNESNRSESDLYECIRLTYWHGVKTDKIKTIIEFVETAFSNPTNDGTWKMLKNKFNLIGGCPYRRIKRDFPEIKESLRNRELSKLKKADMLIIERPNYDHYGIFIGGNGSQKIVNVGHKDKNGGIGVETTSFETFVAASKVMHVEYKLINISSPDEIVNKAKEFADKHLYRGMYNLLRRNCEHFARGLADASPYELNDESFEPDGSSSQVPEGFAKGGSVLVAAGAVAAAAAAIATEARRASNDDDDMRIYNRQRRDMMMMDMNLRRHDMMMMGMHQNGFTLTMHFNIG